MKTSTEQDYRERIVRTLIFIQQNLDEDLDLNRLAGVASFSPFHFHRIFRGLTGETLKEHVRRLRLERAARELRQRDRPVTDVAFRAGFEAHESFTRAFGEMFGMSPSAYRAAHRPAPESASGTHLDDVGGYHSPEYPELPPVEVRQLEPMRVVFVRHVGRYQDVGSAWARLMMWAGMRGLFGPDTKMIGITHDDPDVTPDARIRYDAAITVQRPVTPEGDFGVQEIPGGSYAVIEHRGPYEGLSDTYRKVCGGWLPHSGQTLRDVPAFEMYLNSPQDTRPEDLRTLIHIPLE